MPNALCIQRQRIASPVAPPPLPPFGQGYVRKRFPRAPWAKLHRAVGAALLSGAAYNCLLGAAMIGWMETGMKSVYSLVCAAMASAALLAAVMEVQRRRRSAHAKLERKL